MRTFTLLIMFSMISFTLFSQEQSIRSSDSLRKDAINVYMEAADNYMKTEIPFVNYVRDKNDADLIIITTYQQTGAGGYEYTAFIEGQYRFSGMMDTLKVTTLPNETKDMIRSKTVNILKIGLMKYIVNTPLAEYIKIDFSQPIEGEVSTDNWNNWVFTTGIHGGLSGQESSNSHSIGSNINAGRVTSEWKLNFNMNYNYSHTEYSYYGVEAKSTEKSSNASTDIAKSLNNHWSVGISADVYTSIYSNYNLGVSLAPSIEYNFYPYSESTRRQLLVFYSIGAKYNNYIDTTVFFKTEELLYLQRITAAYNILQKWGSIIVSSSWSNYLHDFSLNNINMGGMISLRVARGLNVTIGGTYSFIHDQVNLRKGNASVEDVLLGRQELSTKFSFESGFGITYTFGSIYNNVVNPRLTQLFR
jgi:hypothetical protein